MKCSWVRKNISAFLDGELNDNQKSKIEAHLKGCYACCRERKLLNSSWEVLDRWKGIEPSSHFKAGFWRRIEEQESLKRKPVFYPRLFPRWAVTLATMVILLFSVYYSRLSFNTSVYIQEEIDVVYNDIINELTEEMVLETMITEEILNEVQVKEGGALL